MIRLFPKRLVPPAKQILHKSDAAIITRLADLNSWENQPYIAEPKTNWGIQEGELGRNKKRGDERLLVSPRGRPRIGNSCRIRDTTSTATKEAVEKAGRKAWIFTADLAVQDQVANIAKDVTAAGHKVDILVNCAGIQRRHPCEEFPDNDWNDVLQVNLNSVFTLCRDFGREMLSLPISAATGRRGSIINFASLLTFQGGFTVPAYAASKGAVGQVTKSFANEWTAKGITVNAIAPGYIETEMNTALLNNPERLASISARIPAGRWGSPEDFKGTAVYLASKASAYVSGHTLVVDGGWMGR